MDNILKRIKDKKLLLCLFLCTIIFLVIFNKFVFKGYVYIFSSIEDIGLDTVSAYYPNMYRLSKMLHEGTLGFFSLNSGLGYGSYVEFVHYINPLDLISLLVPTSCLHVGILISTYLKLITISFFSYKFIELIFHDKKISIICALMWTFSSYVMIWGQHYSFCTSMAYFTMLMYYLQKMIINESYGFNVLFVLVLTFSAINSYYFLYNGGVFCVFYVVGYSWYQKIPFRQIFFRIIKLGLYALLGVLLSAVFLFPVLQEFFLSNRTSSSPLISSLFEVKSTKSLLTIFSRFINASLIGGGFQNTWSGTWNYYEAAFLSISYLSIYSIVYSLFYDNVYRKKNIITFIFCLIIIVLPISSYITTFTLAGDRWTYMLIFIEFLAIANFLKYFFSENYCSKNLFKLTLIGNIVILILLISISVLGKPLGIKIQKFELLCSIGFLAIYTAFILLAKNKNYIILIVCIECIVVNYKPFNERGNVKVKEFYSSEYFDGTIEAVEYLKKYDTSVYRIDKSYVSSCINDSLVQGYYPLKTYDSTNSKYLYDFADLNKNHRYKNTSCTYNCIDVSTNNAYYKAMLGEKYFLTNQEMLSSDYAFINKVGNIYIYQNVNYISFGVMYDTEINYNDLKELDSQISNTLLYYNYYRNNAQDKKQSLEKIESNLVISNNLRDKYVDYTNAIVKSLDNDLIIEGLNDDVNIVYDISEYDLYLSSLKINITLEKDSSLQVFYDYGYGFNEQQSRIMNVQSGENEFTLDLDENCKRVRIDPTDSKQNVILHSLTLNSINKDLLKNKVINMRDAGLYNTVYESSTLYGEINNDTLLSKMLVIPIIFSDDLSAYVDGNIVQIYNVDNGLVGIEVGPGIHSVKLMYIPTTFKIGAFVSGLTILFLLFFKLYSSKRMKEGNL